MKDELEDGDDASSLYFDSFLFIPVYRSLVFSGAGEFGVCMWYSYMVSTEFYVNIRT